ncbi:B12-binding domain-containing radical SAM protein [Halanaerobacter jeridensis]|uniref:Radical SAM superfamily enzyme YgiQ (UPF0313 family) n=1 Tax=Halanaerobacter jeridensis TaxID=706427 RepID=A0A939BTB4_9FIRM|nr:radical SAM protein [Halanaerobacter jeridensis]MBM7558081.1 radical SAM superfamily enzyme YgiQ (UPF0313 family) [Halanaerobacter jeridensis]
MKVLLLNPPFKTKHGKFSRTSRSPAVTKSGTLYYPFWLSYATGVVEEAGHKVKLVDACAKGYDKAKTIKLVKDYNPDLVVLDTSTPSIYNDVQVASEIKNNLSNCFVTLVGTHPSVLIEETLDLDKSIDAIAKNEYDCTIKELSDILSNNQLTSENRKDILSQIKGLSFRVDDQIIHNDSRELIDDLDKLPFVTKIYNKHLDIKNYFFSAAKYPMAMIITGRGCPARCKFCVYPQAMHSRKYRYRSAEDIVEEFEYIVDNMPEIKSIGIEDDTFTFDKKRVKKVCDLLIDKEINKEVDWWVNARVNTLDLETMKLMKKAGCRLLIAGFESGSQKVLNGMNKGINLKDSREFTKNAKQAGLLVHGCFMVGNPGETKETMDKTLEFAKQLNPDTAQFYPMIPYPGTEAYDWAKNNDYLKDYDYDGWLTQDGLHKTIIDPGDLTAEELVSFCSKARKEFYLRPKYILYKLKQSLTDYQEFKRTFKSFIKFAKHLYNDFRN